MIILLTTAKPRGREVFGRMALVDYGANLIQREPGHFFFCASWQKTTLCGQSGFRQADILRLIYAQFSDLLSFRIHHSLAD